MFEKMSKLALIDLNDYKIIRKLGRGGYADVYLVENITTNKLYAAKININELESFEEQKMFFSEIETFCKVDSPSILKFIGFNMKNFSNENKPTIILDYMPNGSLDQIIAKERSSSIPDNWTNTKKYINLLGVALGMKYLHFHNIVHRDLKPENILLDNDLYPQISDFGLAKFLEQPKSQNQMNSGVGTPTYMAPEILTGSEYNYKVDIYSYSLIAYELLTLKRPFPRIENPFLLIRQISEGKRPDISMIKDQFHQQFLMKCWSADPSERPSFDQIIEMLYDDKFTSHFNIDKNEVNHYLCRFPDEIKGTKKQNDSNLFNFKLSVLGNFESGKVDIIDSFIFEGKKENRYNSFILFPVKTIHTELGDCRLEIYDNSGFERFHSLPKLIFCSHATIIVVNANIEDHFEYLIKTVNLIKKSPNNQQLIYIAARNICDGCVISQEKIQSFADEIESHLFVISLDNYSSIKSMFMKVVTDLQKKYPDGPPEINISNDNNQNTEKNRFCSIE